MEWIIVLTSSALLPFVAWRIAGSGHTGAQAIFSPLFYFTFIWYLAFPLRGFLLQMKWTVTQSGYVPTADHLLAAVLLSGVLMAVVLAAAQLRWQPRLAYEPTTPVGATRPALMFLLLLGLAVWFLSRTVLQGGEWHAFVGNTQNEARVGSGHFFVLAELFVFGLYGLFGIILAKRESCLSAWFLILLAAPLIVIMTLALNSRRILAAYLMMFAVVFVVRKVRGATIPLLIVLSMVLTAPALQLFRYTLNPAFDPVTATNATQPVVPKGVQSIAPSATPLVEPSATSPVTPASVVVISPSEYYLKFSIISISSSFEGADHLAALLEKASWRQLFSGVDFGKSWLYNVGLALVPRAAWPNKPAIYGSVAQQQFLYSEMYRNGPATVTLPLSLPVDFLFGFGLVGALVLCFFLGKILAVLQIGMWNANAQPVTRAIALFCFVNAFNLVRGGTAMIQGLFIFLVVAALIIGMRRTFSATVGLLQAVWEATFPCVSIGPDSVGNSDPKNPLSHPTQT